MTTPGPSSKPGGKQRFDARLIPEESEVEGTITFKPKENRDEKKLRLHKERILF